MVILDLGLIDKEGPREGLRRWDLVGTGPAKAVRREHLDALEEGKEGPREEGERWKK